MTIHSKNWRLLHNLLMPADRRPLRRGTPGKAYPEKKIRRALQARHERTSRTNRKLKSYAAAAREAGVLHAKTVWRWDKQDMSNEARATRNQNRAHNRLLTVEQERIAAGWVLSRHQRDLSTKTSYLKLFIAEAFRKTATASFCTRFMQRQHLSLRKIEATKHILLTEEKRDEAINFLQRMRKQKILPDHMVVMDKTKLAALHDESKEIAPKGRCVRLNEKVTHPPVVV